MFQGVEANDRSWRKAMRFPHCHHIQLVDFVLVAWFARYGLKPRCHKGRGSVTLQSQPLR
jgi:hypothetical protein